MAAGASSRMNGIKQLMPWKDSNFLLETIKTVEQSNATATHVILGSNAEIIISECNLNDKDIGIAINPNWTKGLGNSIAYGVNTVLKGKAEVDGILICLADQPLLHYTYLNSLMEEFYQHPSKIIATNYGKKVGVPALFPKLLFDDLSNLEGDYGAKKLLNHKKHAIISFEVAHQNIDIDTKEEYEELINKTNSDTKA
ncbi:molybdenum cofactor cytidylyltransferase [Maribacter ulvicola]|uniref:Molybdenum cofactor cytidylyltransferase n=2 Tax=Maribacter ulvicola TaxID=228959 RepID=A0A1N6UN45_9FLAO|nr:molybdenum cofactor cytidylyltransferase [Maribacter ulvicola]